MIVFILLPVFITIINNSFKIVCDSLRKRDYSMSDYLLGKFYNLFSNKSTYKVNNCEKTEVVYKDHIEYFGDKIDEILTATNRVKNHFFI